MSCQHKFYKDLHLEHIDFEPTTLIVGTFDPKWPADNTAEWFYGRIKDSCFWDVLPRLYGEASLINAGPAEWKRFCRNKQIALTGLISSIDDADPANPAHKRMLGGFHDNAIIHNFEDLNYVNIVQLLQRHPTIRNVYITRSITEAFWRHLWNPVMHYCNANSLYERKLPDPSDEDASYQHKAHNRDNPGDLIPTLEDYILKRWKQEWHFREANRENSSAP